VLSFIRTHTGACVDLSLNRFFLNIENLDYLHRSWLALQMRQDDLFGTPHHGMIFGAEGQGFVRECRVLEMANIARALAGYVSYVAESSVIFPPQDRPWAGAILSEKLSSTLCASTNMKRRSRLFPPIAAWRTRLWLLSGWECWGRRLSRGRGNPGKRCGC
jgi:hypothetical protein